MTRSASAAGLGAPFLRELSYQPDCEIGDAYPFSLPLFARPDFRVAFTRPVTILVGENGAGKSTLLEAIAKKCGFSLAGGNRNQRSDLGEDIAPLAAALRLSWLPKVTNGFFLRAETFFNFASTIDVIHGADPDSPYGPKPLHEQSHGEAFLALLGNRIRGRGIYIMDEPDAALSPSRQLAFLMLLRELEQSGEAQVLFATHSPILLAFPGAQVLELGTNGISEVDFRQTNHFRLMRRFLDDPESYLAHLFR